MNNRVPKIKLNYRPYDEDDLEHLRRDYWMRSKQVNQGATDDDDDNYLIITAIIITRT